jgi:hypothetical protein
MTWYDTYAVILLSAFNLNNTYHEMQGRQTDQADMDLFQSPLSNDASSFYRTVSSDSSMSVFSDLGSGSATMSSFC